MRSRFHLKSDDTISEFFSKTYEGWQPQQKKKKRKFLNIWGELQITSSQIEILLARGPPKAGVQSLATTTNDSLVLAGATCEHSKQTGWKLCRPSHHTALLGILAALQRCLCRWLDFCMLTVRGGQRVVLCGLHKHTHTRAHSACPLVCSATSRCFTPQERNWLKYSQWCLTDLAHVFCTTNSVCVGRSVLLGTPQEARYVTAAASHYARQQDREAIGSWLRNCVVGQKHPVVARHAPLSV